MKTLQVIAPDLSFLEVRELIASRIREARQESGLSQKNVAEALFCDQATISRMERGLVAPDAAQIRMMSGLFRLSVLWLMGYPSFVVHATTRR
jgi:transcriptional regulator with XRE-family HTH domain